MDDEIQINTLIDEILEMSPCERFMLQRFNISELQSIKEKISQGCWHEYVIDVMRFRQIIY